MAYRIMIESGDTTTHKLTLHPAEDPLKVKKGKRVVWSIGPDATHVVSFAIQKKDNSEEIFTFLDRPPSRQVKEGGGTVGMFTRDYAIYDYSIEWIDTDGKPHLHDPKIAVEPGIPLLPFTGLIAVISLVLCSFFFIRPFRDWLRQSIGKR